MGVAPAATCVPDRVPWWAFFGAAGATASIGGALVAGGALDCPRTCAVLATAWLIVLAGLPWWVTRSRGWLEPSPARDGEHGLLERARRTRRVLDAVALAGAGAVAVTAAVPALTGDSVAIGFAAAVATVIGSRPRTRRALDVVEGVVAVSVLPVLAGVLGLYALAADAGARL